LLALVVAACRNGVSVAPLDASIDLQAPPPCAVLPACLACCSRRFESGALDYDSHLMTCACAAANCQSACAATVCGASVGVDGPCRACLASALVDGGVCSGAASECLVTAGPCAAFAACVASCPS
jgi:hypothetical protein